MDLILGKERAALDVDAEGMFLRIIEARKTMGHEAKRGTGIRGTATMSNRANRVIYMARLGADGTWKARSFG
jgi:hypothetical protein